MPFLSENRAKEMVVQGKEKRSVLFMQWRLCSDGECRMGMLIAILIIGISLNNTEMNAYDMFAGVTGFLTVFILR